MRVKDHEQASPSIAAIRNPRVRRCLSFAIVLLFAMALVLGLYREPRPKPTQLHLDTIAGLHRYASTPEAGMPALPFRNNALRKAAPEPFFYTGDLEDEE